MVDRGELRGAVYRTDVDALARLLASGREWPVEALQLLGDAVLMAVDALEREVEPAARWCVRELRDRGWEGDDELATQLEAAFGWTPAPLLRWVPVDLEELAAVLEGDPSRGGGRVDLRTGEVWPNSLFDIFEETEDDDKVKEDDDG